MAVVAGAMLDHEYRSALSDTAAGRAWFAAEQRRVHALVNRAWPRALGTTPMGMARALTVHSRRRAVRYRWRLWRGRRDRLADVLDAVRAQWPVPMLVGRVIPRHWVLIVAASADLLQCYDPASGEVLTVAVDAVRHAQLRGLGYPRPFAFVLPSSVTRAATA